MKILSLVLVVVLAAAGMAGCSTKKPAETAALAAVKVPVLSGPKKRVGIFEFENKSRYGQNRLSNSAVDALYSELQQRNAFVLYERADLEQLGREFDLIDAGVINLDTAAEAGKLVGVQAVVVGTITQFGMWEEAKDIGVYKKKVEIAEATVDVRVVDVTTGRIIYADSGTGRTERELKTVLGFGQKASFDETMADKALRAAMEQFVDKLIVEIVKLPWQGYVMDVDNAGGAEILYLNAGRTSGMPVGQKLIVKRVTGKLTDPVTGEFKGYKTLDLGTAEVYELSGEDVSLARLASGSGVKRGDMVTIAP
ncbi:MAG TPA: CsgG/HfaB family protein [bacterium]|nr:CsgG/HfaB family protein [bacterium]